MDTPAWDSALDLGPCHVPEHPGHLPHRRADEPQPASEVEQRWHHDFANRRPKLRRNLLRLIPPHLVIRRAERLAELGLIIGATQLDERVVLEAQRQLALILLDLELVRVAQRRHAIVLRAVPRESLGLAARRVEVQELAARRASRLPDEVRAAAARTAGATALDGRYELRRVVVERALRREPLGVKRRLRASLLPPTRERVRGHTLVPARVFGVRDRSAQI
jgi:hypothetical protein